MIIDCHGLSVLEAMNEIKIIIQSAIKHGCSYVKVIHGFNNGASIKKRLQNLKDENITSIISLPSNPGVTIIYLKIKSN